MVSGTHNISLLGKLLSTLFGVIGMRELKVVELEVALKEKKRNHTMKVSVPASAARTPPDTGASNMTGITKLSTNNEICQSLYMDKHKVSQAYLKIKLWSCIKFHFLPYQKKNQRFSGSKAIWKQVSTKVVH